VSACWSLKSRCERGVVLVGSLWVRKSNLRSGIGGKE
jgi:hypothetical protein